MCDYSLYKSTVDSDIDIGTESIMFSGCPSVCACVRVARYRSFPDLLAVDFSLCVYQFLITFAKFWSTSSSVIFAVTHRLHVRAIASNESS